MKQPENVPIGKNKYKLTEDYTVCIKIGNGCWGDYDLTIPKGFISDGNSVPKWLSWFMRRDGLVRGPSVVHDFLYKCEGWGDFVTIYQGDKDLNFLTRKQCDQLYKKLLIKAGISSFKAKSAYCGVRSFGWMYWGSK
jgi:hypothetical protein